VTDHWDGTHPEDVLAEAAGPVIAEWQVLVEETVGFGSESYRWKLTRAIACDDEDTARERAWEMAEEFQPEHPMSPQGRRIYEVGTDSWLVHIPGATTDFHFRVTAARLAAAYDEDGESLV
jgi:hypothetical protein